MKTQREILGENLERLINSKGIDQKILAEKIGVSDATISYWMRGLKYPRIDKIQALADYFNVKHADLVSERKHDLIKDANNIYQISQRTIRIPVLGKIACGDPILAEQNYEDYRTVLEEALPSGNLVYLEAKGDSMTPTIPNGAMVLIREQPDVESGEIAAVLVNNNEEATLKRIKKQEGMVILMPDNPAHEPFFVTENNPAKIIGKAIKFEQDL